MDGALLGQVILAVHLVVIAFNVIGLAAIPLGGVLGWSWVRLRWLRLLHLASLGIVAVQAALGEACFLPIWQAVATGEAPEPLITRWVNSLIYWPLPMWVFTTAYITVFAYVLALWWLVPPRTARR